MKITEVCLLAVLVSSCQQVVDDPTQGRSANSMKRQGEVRKLIISHFHLGADVIRGPLTVEQVEKELDERAKEEWPDGRATFKGPEWNQLKSKVKQGGEFYFYESDRPSWTDIFPSVEGACLQHCHDLAVSGPLPQFA